MKRFRQRHPPVIAMALTDEIVHQPRRLRVPFTVARWCDLDPDHIPIVGLFGRVHGEDTRRPLLMAVACTFDEFEELTFVVLILGRLR